MKVIVVYYSLEENSKYVAETITELTGADVLRLEPVKEYPTGKVSKFFWGGKSVMFGEKPTLKPYKFDKSNYDVVIIGTPVWAASFAPPLKTFMSENDLKGKKIALYACSTSGSAEACFNKMKQAIGVSEDVPTLSLIDPLKNKKEENIKKIEAFCKAIEKK